MALPNSQYGLQLLFNGNEQNTARDGVFDTAKAQALDYNKLATELKDIADDLLKASLVIPKTNIEATIIDLDSRITAIVTGVGNVEVLRVPTDHSDVSDALAAAEAGSTKYTIILIEGAVPAGAQAVTITRPTKFIGTSDIAEIDFGATKVIVDFPATSELARLEFDDLKISRSDTAEAFDIVGDCVIRFSNCVITDDVVAAPTFAMFETVGTLEVFLQACLLQTTAANGLIFKSGTSMTVHMNDTNANNITNTGTIFDGGAGLTLNMSNHSFIDQVKVTTTAYILTYDGTSIHIDNSTLTASSKTIHGYAYFDTRMGGVTAINALQHHVTPSTGGRKVLIGPGTYNMSSDATISVSGIEIEGSGPGTILKVTGSPEALTISASNITVSDLQIQLAGSSLRGITVSGGTNHNIRNILFDNISGTNFEFIRFLASEDSTVSNCIGKITAGSITKFFVAAISTGPITISGCISNGMNNAFETRTPGTIFDNCQATSSTASAKLYIIDAVDCLLSNCIGTGNGAVAMTGVFIDTGADRAKIDDCNFKDFSKGIDIATSTDDIGISNVIMQLPSGASVAIGINSITTVSLTIESVIIDGNANSNVSSFGIQIFGITFKMSILGCKIRNLSAGDGISFTSAIATTTDSIIANCRIESVGGLGIHIKNMERVTVTGNHVRASGSDNIRLEDVLESNVSVNHCSGSVAGWGINETGAANFNLIGTNHCRGNSSGAVNVVGANSVESDTMS